MYPLYWDEQMVGDAICRGLLLFIGLYRLIVGVIRVGNSIGSNFSTGLIGTIVFLYSISDFATLLPTPAGVVSSRL